jgi:hypothetical protein
MGGPMHEQHEGKRMESLEDLLGPEGVAKLKARLFNK